MRKFKRVYIEITNVCNLACSFCPKTVREGKFISCEDFERVLINLGDKSEYIYLHVMGEPLLHPQLEKILDIALQYNKKVVITTNGSLIKEHGDIILKAKAVYKVVFSLHSYEANECGIDVNEYINGIIDFCKKAQKSTQIISVMRLWNFDKDTIKGENELNDKIVDMIFTAFGQSCDELVSIKSSRGIKIMDRVFLQGGEIFKWPDYKEELIGDKVFCYALRDHFGILVDGTVIPCCLDNDGRLALGNCFNEDLDKILNCEKAVKIYNGFTNRNASEELCKRCEFVTRFTKK